MEWNWWVLLTIPGWWFLQNVIHEGSHLLVGWWHEGLKPLGFYPYPHVRSGRFYFARYTHMWPPTKGPRKGTNRMPKHLPIYIAPFIFGMSWAIIFSLGIVFASPTVRLWLLPPVITGVVDSLWFWRGFFWGSTNSDGKRWRHGNG